MNPKTQRARARAPPALAVAEGPPSVRLVGLLEDLVAQGGVTAEQVRLSVLR